MRERAAPPEALDDDPLLSRLASRDVATAGPGTTAEQAWRTLVAHRVRHLPVVDGLRCVGVLVDSLVLRAIADDRPDAPALRLCVPLPVLDATARRSAAARAMRAAGVDAVAVRDAPGGPVTGIVTASDVVDSLIPPARER